MPRSRRFLALCALLTSLAWTNAQAMTCCWTARGAESEAVSAGESAHPEGCHASAAPEAPAGSGDAPAACDAFGAAFGATGEARLAACCEAFAPAETFVHLPDFEPAPAPGFLAFEPSGPAAPGDAPDFAPPRDPPRFLSERLLI